MPLKFSIWMVVAALMPLAGCFGSNSEPKHQWGLGLDMSQTPSPAPFSENFTDLQRFFSFLNESAEPLLARCKTSAREEDVQHHLSLLSPITAWQILREACDEHRVQTAIAMLQKEQANGTDYKFVRDQI